MAGKKWIGTNWKMRMTLSEADIYLKNFRDQFKAVEGFQIFLVLPFTHLDRAKKELEGVPVLLGAQNMHWADEGEFTGEISPLMLKDIGVDLVEIGHSERRRLYNEDDYSINKKILAALNHDIIPLVCVGEGRVERNYGIEREVISRQVKISLHDVVASKLNRVIFAYEPIWAIGEHGTPASPDEVCFMHSHIRELLVDLYGHKGSDQVRILYGGSVNRSNAAAFINEPNVDGVFISRAGLDSSEFLALIKLIQQVSGSVRS